MAALDLAATVQGEGPALIALHGLFGSARNWHSVARRLAEGRAVHTLDMRNHGASPWAETMSYPEMAEDVLAHIRGKGLSRPVVMGHSMGGKAAMVAALTAPERVDRLIVVDIAPVRYGQGFAPLVEALAALDLEQVTRRTDADALLENAVPEAAVRGFLLQNLVLKDGRYGWRIHLDAIARNQSALWDFPDLPPSCVFDRPTLFIAGGGSDYVRPDHGPVIERYFPAAETVRIPGAGHWVHADAPDAFLDTVQSFLHKTGG